MVLKEAFNFNKLTTNITDIQQNIVNNTFTNFSLSIISEYIKNFIKTKCYPFLRLQGDLDIFIEDIDIKNKSFIINCKGITEKYKFTVHNNIDLEISVYDYKPYISRIIFYLINYCSEYNVIKISCMNTYDSECSRMDAPSGWSSFYLIYGGWFAKVALQEKLEHHIIITEEMAKRFSKIEIPEAPRTYNAVSLKEGWLFETPEAFNIFYNWLCKYGYTKFYHDTPETKSLSTFNKRKWRVAKEDYNKAYGSFFIQGKKQPRAKDLIIEAFDFSKLPKINVEKDVQTTMTNISIDYRLNEIINLYKKYSIVTVLNDNPDWHMDFIKNIKDMSVDVVRGNRQHKMLTIKLNNFLNDDITIYYPADHHRFIGYNFILNYPGHVDINVEVECSNSVIIFGVNMCEKAGSITENTNFKLNNISVYTSMGKIVQNPKIAVQYISCDCMESYFRFLDELENNKFMIQFLPHAHIVIKGTVFNMFRTQNEKGKENYFYKAWQIWKNQKNTYRQKLPTDYLTNE